MNRRILIQVTAPAAVIGLLLFVTCLVSAWIVNQLQMNRSRILSQNVTSLEAAQEVEINLRRLRFLCFLYLIDPDQARLEQVTQVSKDFQQGLEHARQSANSADEQSYLRQMQDGYDRYQQEFQRLRTEVARTGPRRNFRELADEDPIRHVVEPCDRLMRTNKEMMSLTSQESDRISRILQFMMLFLGVGGPISGLILGYGFARGLSRSIYRLKVHVLDMAHHLDQDIASVSVATDGDLQSLDKQLREVVHRVEEVAQRLQQHQREMLRAQQMSAVAQLAASVAHEVRNPLTSIKMLIEAALLAQNSRPLKLGDLQIIHAGITRLEQTVQCFLDFARLPTPQRTSRDVWEVIAHAIDLVRVRAGQQQVDIIGRSPESSLIAWVDGHQLCTVLVNLFINALDAMPTGGQLEVCLDREPTGDLRIAVSDTGPGFPSVVLERLFQPFVSTKPTGTGLGLSISQRIVEEHGGTVVARNRPAGGTCLAITLPAPTGDHLHAQVAGSR